MKDAADIRLGQQQESRWGPSKMGLGGHLFAETYTDESKVREHKSKQRRDQQHLLDRELATQSAMSAIVTTKPDGGQDLSPIGIKYKTAL